MGRFRAAAQERDSSPFGRFRQRVWQGIRPCLRRSDRQADRRQEIGMIARRLLLVGPALLSVASCGGPPAPAVVELSIRASSDVNPNPAGTPVSVAVRLYSLTARGRFMSADAYALMDRKKATL